MKPESAKSVEKDGLMRNSDGMFHAPSEVRRVPSGPHDHALSDPRWCARKAQSEADPERAGGALPIADRADFDPTYDPAAPIECEVCGGTMRYIAACKILCDNCGYRRDCSDP